MVLLFPLVLTHRSLACRDVQKGSTSGIDAVSDDPDVPDGESELSKRPLRAV